MKGRHEAGAVRRQKDWIIILFFIITLIKITIIKENNKIESLLCAMPCPSYRSFGTDCVL